MSANTITNHTTQNLSHKRTLYLSTTALFAAMICIMTAYIFHIPTGINGGYIHLGDAVIYLAAALLPTPYAMAAGAIGGALADLLTAPAWAPATLIIKMLIALPFTSKKEKIVTKRNVFALFLGTAITIFGYFIAEGIMFGTWAAFIPSAIGNLIQGAGSGVVFLFFGGALDKMNFKKKFM